MQGQIKIVKITSKKFPDKKWDSVNHFTNFNDDRQIVKSMPKHIKNSNLRYREIIENIGIFTTTILDNSKKYIIRLEIGDSRIIAYHDSIYDQPHVEKGILEIKEIFSLDLELDKIKKLIDFLDKNFNEEDKEWKNFLQHIN